MTLPAWTVLYDGECGLCDRTVQWVLRHDRSAVFHFAALQSDLGLAIRARHPEVPADIDSIMLVEQHPAGERLHVRSRAVFQVLRQMPYPWRLLSWLRFVPAVLSDLGYRSVARLRYAIWGRVSQCLVPTAEQRPRFLATRSAEQRP